jgi:5-methylcytosine-specific restriction protein A
MPIRIKHSRKKSGKSERRARKSYEKLYGSYEWRRYSEQYRREHPECAACGAESMKTHLDHIIPVSLGGSMWDTRNHQTLCNSCHSKKTKREQQNPLPYRLNIDGGKIPLKNYKANRDDLTNDNNDSI